MSIGQLATIGLGAAVFVLVLVVVVMFYHKHFGTVLEDMTILGETHRVIVNRRAKFLAYGQGSQRVVVRKRDDYLVAEYMVGKKERYANEDETREWNRLFSRDR